MGLVGNSNKTGRLPKLELVEEPSVVEKPKVIKRIPICFEKPPVVYIRLSLIIKLGLMQEKLQAKIAEVTEQIGELRKSKMGVLADVEVRNDQSIIQQINARITQLALERDQYQQEIEKLDPHLIAAHNKKPFGYKG